MPGPAVPEPIDFVLENDAHVRVAAGPDDVRKANEIGPRSSGGRFI
jgi:hypothetical protein